MIRRNATRNLLAAGLALTSLASLTPAAVSMQSGRRPRRRSSRRPPARGNAPSGAPPRVLDEQAAIAQIEKAGGRVMQIAQNDERLEVSFRFLGDQATDSLLEPLRALPKVAYLDLAGTAVTDAGLAHLRGLTGLTRLHLERTRITDRGLAHLKNLRNLEYLNLYGTQVTDAGLEHLAGLTKLRSLYVWQTRVTETGVSRLKQALPQLEIVTGSEPAPKQ